MRAGPASNEARRASCITASETKSFGLRRLLIDLTFPVFLVHAAIVCLLRVYHCSLRSHHASFKRVARPSTSQVQSDAQHCAAWIDEHGRTSESRTLQIVGRQAFFGRVVQRI